MVLEAPIDRDLEETLLAASNGQGLDYFQLPESVDFGKIPQDPKNLLSDEKVKLGQFLYHETALALAPMKDLAMEQYSCASCHFAGAGFQAGRAQGIGDGAIGFGQNGEGRERNTEYLPSELDVQPIRTPAALNTAFQTNMLWNGMFGATGVNTGTEAFWTADTPKETNFLGYEGVETQAIAGLGVHRQVVNKEVLEEHRYKTMFDAAFPEIPEEDRYTKEFAGLAIAAFERTMTASRAPFQRWLRGNRDMMTQQEKEGAILFFTKAKCGSCHTGPALNSMDFHALGMTDLYLCEDEEIFGASAASGANKGRGDFTGREEDMFRFKVPQLYNLKDSPFYGHGSSFRTIREVIDYKNTAVPQQPGFDPSKLDEEFVPLQLTNMEIDAITAFIENGLYDPGLSRFEPTFIKSGNCFPNNDMPSRQDLGCD